MATALLFERDAVGEVDAWAEKLPRLGRSSVLWIDLEKPDEREVEHLADALGLDPATERRLGQPSDSAPQFASFESYVHVTAYAPSARRRLTRVESLVSKHWVVTIREQPLELLDTFRERASGSGEVGRLDDLEFLADLLEWVLESYFDASEEIEVDLEDVDTAAMSGDIESREDVLGRLVDVRREIGPPSTRSHVPPRSHPRADAAGARGISSSHSAERFGRLRDRLEEAARAARDSRESVVGSFDVLIASTSQRTNEIMKVLTLASVVLLPGAVIAGVMGMNCRVGSSSTRRSSG